MRVRDGNLMQGEYDAKHAVYLTVVDCGGEFELTATYCPNFTANSLRAYAVCPEEHAKLVAIHQRLSNEAYPLKGDDRRDLHQRLRLVLDNFIEVREGENL